jgi:hypothetical protein
VGGYIRDKEPEGATSFIQAWMQIEC